MSPPYSLSKGTRQAHSFIQTPRLNNFTPSPILNRVNMSASSVVTKPSQINENYLVPMKHEMGRSQSKSQSANDIQKF